MDQTALRTVATSPASPVCRAARSGSPQVLEVSQALTITSGRILLLVPGMAAVVAVREVPAVEAAQSRARGNASVLEQRTRLDFIQTSCS